MKWMKYGKYGNFHRNPRIINWKKFHLQTFHCIWINFITCKHSAFFTLSIVWALKHSARRENVSEVRCAPYQDELRNNNNRLLQIMLSLHSPSLSFYMTLLCMLSFMCSLLLQLEYSCAFTLLNNFFFSRFLIVYMWRLPLIPSTLPLSLTLSRFILICCCHSLWCLRNNLIACEVSFLVHALNRSQNRRKCSLSS